MGIHQKQLYFHVVFNYQNRIVIKEIEHIITKNLKSFLTSK